MQASCFYYEQIVTYYNHLDVTNDQISHQLQRWGSTYGGWSWDLTE